MFSRNAKRCLFSQYENGSKSHKQTVSVVRLTISTPALGRFASAPVEHLEISPAELVFGCRREVQLYQF